MFRLEFLTVCPNTGPACFTVILKRVAFLKCHENWRALASLLLPYHAGEMAWYRMVSGTKLETKI